MGFVNSALSQTTPAVVLDTNVVLDWLVFHDARVTTLVRAMACGQVRPLGTPAMRQELVYMLGSQRLLRWAPDTLAALQAYDAAVTLVPDPLPAGLPAQRLRCTDPDDQMFLDLALAERARWLFTHDRALLRLARRVRNHALDVLTPMAWASRTATGDVTLT
jgi:putative PIN family toxin of toxin-antitoxin system